MAMQNIQVRILFREEKTIKTAVEHLEGVDRGQALLMEALGYPWSINDKISPTKLLK